MTNYVKKIIFSLTLLCGIFITANVNASVYLEDFTQSSKYLTAASSSDTNVNCYVSNGNYCFDFSNVSNGTSASSYVYQKYFTPQKSLFVEFDFTAPADSTTLRFELRNYDGTLGNSGTYIPFHINKNYINFVDNTKILCGDAGKLGIDITVDSENKATIKIYFDDWNCKILTVDNFHLESKNGFEYRIRAIATGTSGTNGPVVTIDNLKVLTDESEKPTVYFGKPQYYFDFGDNRFLKSENTFTFNRVKSIRQIANFTDKKQSFDSILAQYNNDELSDKLTTVKKEGIELAPGEVITFETVDDAPDYAPSNYVASMIWNNLTPLSPKALAEKSTANVPLPNELALKLSELEGTHPRLLATADDIEKVEGYRQEDETFADMYNALLDWRTTCNSSNFLTCPVPGYNSNVDNVSVIIYNRAVVWGYLYQTTGDENYAADLVRDMLKIASYTDWYYGKKNFLITAHIAAAMAIGYDFTYDYLCKEENAAAKAAICDAIYNYAILPALDVYRKDAADGWQRRPDNWNMICNGGIATACMAIGDIEKYSHESAIALNYALRLIEQSFGYFAPEGAWVEGMGYYGYMMGFGSDLISSLKNTFGDTLGYTKFSGFAQSAADTIKLSGSLYIYNYSDAATDATNRSSLLSFFGKYFDRPELGFLRRHKFENQYKLIENGEAPLSSITGVYGVKDLIWYTPEFKDRPANAGKDGYDSTYGIETDTCYTGTGIVALHDDFSANQAFVAANCGKNSDYHTHVDMGSFVYESAGEQWFVDLGLNDYSLTDCFNKQYYRLKPEGHNCVVINPDANSLGQVKDAEGSITATSFGSDESWFVMDITSAYADYVSDYKRLIYLDKETQGFAVKDKFTLNGTNNEFYWFAHTPAAISLSADGKTATLTKPNGKTLKVMLQSEGTFEIMAAERLYDAPKSLGLSADPANTGYKKLAIHRTGMSGECEITVVAVPNDAALPDISKIAF